MLLTEVEKKSDEIQNPLKPIFKDMLKYGPSKIFGIVGNTIVIPIYTNLLSPEQYGVYVIAIAVLGFLCILFSDWVGLSGLRFFRVHQIKDEIPKYLTTLVGLLTANISVMFFLAFMFRQSFYDFFKISPKMFVLILFLIIPVAIRALLFQILRAQIKPSAFTISTILNQILTILISVCVIKYFHLGAISILIGMAVSISFIDILLMFQSNIFSYFRFEKIQTNILQSLFKYGVPIAVTSISLWIITQSNKFILQHLNGYKDVGLVGVAFNITVPTLMTLFAIITIAAFPRIINLYEDKVDVRPIISELTGYFILIALPVITLMAIYPKDIVVLLANKKFLGAYILIPYLAFSTFFLSLAEYTTMQYHLINKTYIDTIIKIISGTVGIILNFVLIQKMGILGVAIATFVANFLYFLLSIMIVMPSLNWQIPYKKISKILISFVPFFGLYYFFSTKTDISALYQMIALISVYYAAYALIPYKASKNV